ncbi:MAG: C_GCAxxG_C_C family protein [Actinobacteria bacterium]|nr:C_GCAxxG_C_C family protein [Actinomycetota bacterium]
MTETGDSVQVGEKAVGLFQSGMNCAESVLAANMEVHGVDEDWVPRVASGFGGGIARTGQVCGAITGAIMVLGWVYGRDCAGDDIDSIHKLGQKLIDEFIDEYATTSCGMLIDIDLRNPEAREKADNDGIFDKRCTSFIRFCAGRVAEMISD